MYRTDSYLASARSLDDPVLFEKGELPVSVLICGNLTHNHLCSLLRDKP
jgi:hypothetical protein